MSQLPVAVGSASVRSINLERSEPVHRASVGRFIVWSPTRDVASAEARERTYAPRGQRQVTAPDSLDGLAPSGFFALRSPLLSFDEPRGLGAGGDRAQLTEQLLAIWG